MKGDDWLLSEIKRFERNLVEIGRVDRLLAESHDRAYASLYRAFTLGLVLALGIGVAVGRLIWGPA